MSLRIRLEDEHGYEVASMDRTSVLNPLIPSLDDEQYTLLGYIDLDGDTIFGAGQAAVLAQELSRAKVNAYPDALESIDQIIALANRAAADGSLYLKFLGD
ncbi:MAG: hypothetical protein LH606_19330 [Cytophagaceae bacterium]|nr:hypothetical protein [Cytophagaceae bacterium]